MTVGSPEQSPSLRVHAALLSVSVIYGFFFVTLKLLLQDISQSELVLLRLVLSAILVALAEGVLFRSRIRSLRDGLWITLYGLMGVFAVQALLVLGVHRTTAFHSSLLIATIPLWTLTFSLLLKREPFAWYKPGGIGLAFIGVAWLIFAKDNAQVLPPTYLAGDAILLGGSMVFAMFLVGSRNLLQHYPSFSLMAYYYIVSALALLIFWPLIHSMDEPGRPPLNTLLQRISPMAWGMLAYTVLFASILTYLLNNYGLRRATPSLVAMYIFIQPILSALFGFYILHEPFTLAMALAALVTFSGMMLTNWGSLRKHPQSREADSLKH